MSDLPNEAPFLQFLEGEEPKGGDVIRYELVKMPPFEFEDNPSRSFLELQDHADEDPEEDEKEDESEDDGEEDE